jgi:hypothetical protein
MCGIGTHLFLKERNSVSFRVSKMDSWLMYLEIYLEIDLASKYFLIWFTSRSSWVLRALDRAGNDFYIFIRSYGLLNELRLSKGYIIWGFDFNNIEIHVKLVLNLRSLVYYLKNVVWLNEVIYHFKLLFADKMCLIVSYFGLGAILKIFWLSLKNIENI